MDWNTFPYDMQEHILGCLPLVELARIATTADTFQKVCRRRVAEQQKGRCDSAEKWVGRKRITAVIDLVDGFLNGDRMLLKRPRTIGFLPTESLRLTTQLHAGLAVNEATMRERFVWTS
jgi:hypothetical protein